MSCDTLAGYTSTEVCLTIGGLTYSAVMITRVDDEGDIAPLGTSLSTGSVFVTSDPAGANIIVDPSTVDSWTVGACGSNTVTQSYDYELACFDDGAGSIVTGFVVADQNTAPPGGLTFWVNGTDVTATHVVTTCPAGSVDFEVVEKCFRDVTDPSVTFTRVTAVDANLNVLSTVWFDTNGVAVPAPLNVEACADDVYPKSLGTVLGCLDRNCSSTVTSEPFTAAEFLLQTVLAASGTIYTIQYDFATVADATRFYDIQQFMSQSGVRSDSFGFIFYLPEFFVSGTQTGTTVTVVFDVSATVPTDDAATRCGHVEPDYVASMSLVQGFWDFIGVGNSDVGADFVLNAQAYTGGPTTVQITKFEIAENVFQDKIFLPPRTPGDPLVELTGLEIGETLNLGGCADVAAQTVLCAGTETIMGGADPASNNFLNVMAPVVADGSNAALIGNSGDGLIIDGTPWVFNVPTAQEFTLTVPDLESFDYVQDSASNQWLFGGPVTLDLTVDPTAVGFVAALQTEIQNAYLASGFAPSAVTTVTIVTINPGVNVVIQIVTENVPLIFYPVFMQFLHQTNGNTYGFSDYRRGWETNYQFSATLPPGATLTSISFEVDYELFDPANLNEIFLGACLPSNTILVPAGDQYAFDGALSVGPTTVTYSPGLTGTNSITNLPYTIDANSLLDIGCWVYWGEFGHGQINVDGVRMRYTYTLPIEGTGQLVIVCQSQLDQLVNNLILGLQPAPLTVERPHLAEIVNGASLSTLFGTTQVSSFSVGPKVGGWVWSEDGGATFTTANTHFNSWSEGSERLVDVTNIVIAPANPGDVTVISWEL